MIINSIIRNRHLRRNISRIGDGTRVSQNFSFNKILFSSSSGIIIDPYTTYYDNLRQNPNLFTPAGLSAKAVDWKSKLSSGVSFGLIKKHVPGFDLKIFPPLAKDIFEQFTEAHAKGDLKQLIGLVTDDFYVNLKAELKRSNRMDIGKRKVLRFLGHTGPTYVVHGRHMFVGKGAQKKGYGQVTVTIPNRREKCIMNDKKMMISDPQFAGASIFESTTIVVFEASFNGATRIWRIASLIEDDIKTDKASVLMT